MSETLERPQCIEALELANVIRLEQTEVLRTLRRLPSAEAKREAAHLIYDPTETVGGIRLDRFLRAVPRVGEHKMRLLLQDCGLTGTKALKRIRDLTDRERHVISGALHRDALGHERRRKLATA